ncbi:DUF1320 domain-containing protein [Sphingobium aquiterrae]|uniref:DUF1320 domain-containing protein n=1 Tax=Sphingobium aquiterrae TaxID=2038656 RepID=UPI003019E51D
MSLSTLLKQPAEVLHQAMEFSGLLTITALLSIDVQARGLVPAAPALVVEGSIFADALTLVLSGGGDGESYLVTVRVEDAAGQEVESELEVAVIDAAWTMPDGGAPYLTIVEFVKHFGLPETIRMTDPSGTGRIDRDYLVSALVAAQATVELHLSGRYALPLPQPVPQSIKTFIADLARPRLYPNGAPDGVGDQAKAAQRMLERIQSGAMKLPAEEVPVSVVSDTPVLISPGVRAYPDNLRGYC